ncbi:MAG: ferritin family protein [Chloroflexi bacterium]|nr:ferritin family protein [Chloroflexota bacterium]
MTVFTAAEALNMALEIETNGEVFYSAVAARQADPETKAVFEELAAQERVHHQVFSRMLGQVSPDVELPDADYEAYREYVQVALDGGLFAGKDKALRMAEEAETKASAVRSALGFEKDTLLFFYDLREMVPEKEQDAITRIIREEKAHVRRLASML